MAELTLSVTEMPQFRRLAKFLEDVDAYAAREIDLELKGIVDDCHGDLMRISAEQAAGRED
jgi:hypothetical protein